MHLTNILPGSAFKLSLKVVGVYLFTISLASYAIYNAVTQALLYELSSQSEEEITLFTEILKKEGPEELVKVLGGLSHIYVPKERIVGLFNHLNTPIAGNVSVAPDFVGWGKSKVKLTHPITYNALYHTRVKHIEGYTLVVGRSNQLIGSVQEKLSYWLSLSSIFITLITLFLGIISSSQSARKIQHMDDVLQKVAEGDIDTRILFAQQNHPDQLGQLGGKINAHLDQLSELIIGIKSTASAIAHDLKTPLSHIQISLYDALDQNEKGQNSTQALEGAIEEVKSINTTFDTILRISRINAQLNKTHFQWFNIQATIEKITELFEPVYSDINNHISLNYDVPNTETIIFADVSMIEQLIVNLLINIQVHCPNNTEVIIGLIVSENHIVLSVQDNGPGVPEPEIENITKPFHRIDSARTESGNGLGLTLISAIARHHSADLQLKNCHPGLKVSINFPRT